MTEEQVPEVIAKAGEKYTELTLLRAAVQATPYVGGPLDTLLAGGVARIQRQRIEDFLGGLEERLKAVESTLANLEDEAFSDLMLTTLDRVARSRSADKRARFASIISRQVVEGLPWDDAENAVRLLADLEDIHVEVLQVALAAPPRALEVLPAVQLRFARSDISRETAPLCLTEALPHYSEPALRMACAELAAKGLLLDAGVGGLKSGAMNTFVATDLARWFSQWLIAPDSAGRRTSGST
ncbi:MAG: hypothetical protein C3F12_14415 [Candidatus Methylomirabilota bacterium]|nr:hypothetical protein [candidate division NC10 bacterium]PWB42394.1 MAG: hypothetical protein C3F12_14415 [candidate division NC10 bacterium]